MSIFYDNYYEVFWYLVRFWQKVDILYFLVEKKMTLHCIVLYCNYCNSTPYYNGIIVILFFDVVLMKIIKL